MGKFTSLPQDVLVQMCEAKDKRIAELEAQVTEIPTVCRRYEKRIAELEALLNRWMKQYTEGIDADDFRELYLESLEALEQKDEPQIKSLEARIGVNAKEIDDESF